MEHRPGARAAGVDEHVEGGGVVDRVVRAEHQGLGADDGRAVGREAEGVPAVLGVLLRPVGEHLPGTDGVQLLDPVEEEEPDLPALSAAWSWSSGMGSVGLGSCMAVPPGVVCSVGAWPTDALAERI